MQASVVGDTTDGGTFSRVRVLFNSDGLAPGDYTANLCVTGAGTAVTVPVTMTVKPKP